jgi:citrate lyase subunit beta/citryl-CoA lyase
MTLPGRRSCLSVPGSSEHMLVKATTIPADEIVLGLEDSVAASQKDHARALVAASLDAQPWSAATLSVRVNAPGTPWCHADIQELVQTQRLDSIVVPKVGGAGDLAFAERLISGVEAAAGRARPLRLQALIETAAGLARVIEIAAAAERLDALVLGYADLAASLGRRACAPAELWLPAQHAVLVAARAAGRQAIDGPHLDVAANGAFVEAASRARDLGFDGKWAIHPNQVEPLNQLFTPSRAEVD